MPQDQKPDTDATTARIKLDQVPLPGSVIREVHYKACPGSGMAWLTLRIATDGRVEVKVSLPAVTSLGQLLSLASGLRLGQNDTRSDIPGKLLTHLPLRGLGR